MMECRMIFVKKSKLSCIHTMKHCKDLVDKLMSGSA